MNSAHIYRKMTRPQDVGLGILIVSGSDCPLQVEEFNYHSEAPDTADRSEIWTLIDKGRSMEEKGNHLLGLCSRILFIIALGIVILALPFLARRGFIVVLSASFSIILVFLTVFGVLVLWSGRQNFRTWYRQVLKYAIVVDLVLAAVITLAYISTGTPITLAGFELHSVDRVLTAYSAGGWLVLILILWASLFVLTWFFVAALTGTIWLVTRPLQKDTPALLDEIRRLSFEKSDPWPRRIAAWFLIVPKVIDPSLLRLEVRPLLARRSRPRLVRSVTWQIARRNDPGDVC